LLQRAATCVIDYMSGSNDNTEEEILEDERLDEDSNDSNEQEDSEVTTDSLTSSQDERASSSEGDKSQNVSETKPK
jgi:hypothetical protein